MDRADAYVEAAIFGIVIAWRQITISNSLRRTEAITTLYSTFVTDDLYQFYERIRNREPIDWEHKKREKMRLNKALTLFDELCYLQTQKLFQKSDATWEYVASELHYFAANGSVWDYWAHRVHEGLKEGLRKDTIPFTGFSQLYNTMPEKFKAKPFPDVPERHKALFSWVTSSLNQ
jgi:hypothetical protein